jgi:WD40 repeat protein
LEHFNTIHNSPSQIYHSALPLCPPSSQLHKHYTAELSGKVKVIRGFPDGWGTHSRTVKLDSIPWALACWKDTLAVGLESSDIVFLSAITGSQVAVLSGHTNDVTSLAFFPDGTSLVSGGGDSTVKLWDIQTGGVVKTFCGHTGSVNSVSISANCTTVASGSADKTICLWDVQAGGCHCIIKQQQYSHVTFSPTNSQHLISASAGLIQKWDINGHQVGPAHKGTCPAFSPDGTYFISCQEDVSTIWNSDSGVVVAKCQTPNYKPRSGMDLSFQDSCFSPDGRLVAAATIYYIYVWDITSSDPLLIETFVGGSDYFTSITFSSPSTLISSSLVKSVEFWKIGGQSTNPVAGSPMPTPPILVGISSVHLQAESGIAVSNDWDGVLRTWDLSTGLCKASFKVPAISWSLKEAQMIDGRLLFYICNDKGVHIWDTEKGKLLRTMDVGRGVQGGFRMSGDGSKFFCIIGHGSGSGEIGYYSLQAWSIQTGEVMSNVEVGESFPHEPLHVDGSRVWVSFKDKPTQGWDFGVPGPSPVPLSNTSSERPHLCLTHSFDSYDGLVWIEDTATGKGVFCLSGRYAEPVGIQWDGQYLVAGYEFGEVLILDFCDVHPQ